MKNLKCPNCQNLLKEIKVKIQDADTLATSYQCGKCGYFDFEDSSINKAIGEIKIKEISPLRIKQKVIKLSKGRIGMYFNQDVSRSVGLKQGQEIYVSVPDKKHIVLKIES